MWRAIKHCRLYCCHLCDWTHVTVNLIVNCIMFCLTNLRLNLSFHHQSISIYDSVTCMFNSPSNISLLAAEKVRNSKNWLVIGVTVWCEPRKKITILGRQNDNRQFTLTILLATHQLPFHWLWKKEEKRLNLFKDYHDNSTIEQNQCYSLLLFTYFKFFFLLPN